MNNVEQVQTFNEIKGNVHEGFYNKDRFMYVRLCKRTMGPIPMELKFQQVYRSPRDTNEQI